jgi:hypothetical protein
MRVFKSPTWLLTAVFLAPLAHGVQPPNVVESDSDGNTAMGRNALLGLADDGYANTAAGAAALVTNTTGFHNTALGFFALAETTTGGENSASGSYTLTHNTTGMMNSASGYAALFYNTTASESSAFGTFALLNSNGNRNAAFGASTLYNNTTGVQNTALGSQALYGNLSGFRNVAVGYRAGYSVKGKDNITIGAINFGKSTDNGVIRIGSANQVKTYIAGISGVKTGAASAAAVFVDANGQLGTIKSSREYKEDIRPMGSASERLYALKPVTFRYKEAYDDGTKPVEFGLVAEEVAEAFPELVVHDADGRPQTVRYDLVATLLLNEFQKAHGVIESQSAELASLRAEVAAMAEAVARLERERRLSAAN